MTTMEALARHLGSLYNDYLTMKVSTLSPHPITSLMQQKRQETTMKRHIIVNIHKSELFSKLVQEIAFEAGYAWYHPQLTNPRKDLITHQGVGGQDVAIRLDAGGKHIDFSHLPFYDEHQRAAAYLFLDAKTDLGKLIDLLEEAKTPTPPTIHGYPALYCKGSEIVNFGCANISIKLLEDLFSTMGGETEKFGARTWAGNRGVTLVQLSSGKTLTADNIRSILSYVNEVNK